MFKLFFFRVLSAGALATAVFCTSSLVNAAEVNHGVVIVDRKPWKMSWVQESENRWVLLANFDNGELRTYFKKAPPSKGFGLTTDNKPFKQEFKYYPSGKTFISKDCQFEQWPDGAKAYAFSYNDEFKMNGSKFSNSTTAVIEEVGNAPNEIRYSLFRTYN